MHVPLRKELRGKQIILPRVRRAYLIDANGLRFAGEINLPDLPFVENHGVVW